MLRQPVFGQLMGAWSLWCPGLISLKYHGHGQRVTGKPCPLPCQALRAMKHRAQRVGAPCCPPCHPWELRSGPERAQKDEPRGMSQGPRDPSTHPLPGSQALPRDPPHGDCRAAALGYCYTEASTDFSQDVGGTEEIELACKVLSETHYCSTWVLPSLLCI